MRRRHLTTAVTLVVLVGILAVGGVIGAKALFAPVGSDDPTTAAPTCVDRTVKKGQRVRAREVQVSVYNAGSRANLADSTLSSLAKRGFRRGEAANAPTDVAVRKVQVWTAQRNDPAAALVARQFGRGTPIRVRTTNLGPGVDVVVGNSFRRLRTAPRVLVVKKTSTVCVPLPSPSATVG